MTIYRFIYEGTEYEHKFNSPFPSDTTIESKHEFDADQTWHPILWQFCHFLEHIGFEGVRKKVKIDADIDDCLFQNFYNDPRYTEEDMQEYFDALHKDNE
jgi:hypothetical protein